MEQAICYKHRNNTLWVKLYRNGVVLTAVEMAAITKFEILHQGVYYNSVDNPTGFTRDDANGRFKVKPFELGLPISKDLVEVILYDAGDNTNGLYWDTFELSIRGDVVVPTTTATTIAPTTSP